MSAVIGPSIRRGQPADRAAIRALLEAAGLPTADLEAAPDLTLWVMDIEDALVGGIALERYGRQALLRSLVVAPGHRGRGLGRDLVDRLEREARSEGVEQLVLLTEAGEQFFQKLGYERVGRETVSPQILQSAEFRSLCPASAACMRKSLHEE